MNESMNSREKREADSAAFLLDELVDNRGNIEQLLQQKYTSMHCETIGYQAAFIPPVELWQFLVPDMERYSKEVTPIAFEINTNLTGNGDDSGGLSHIALTIIPEDRLPLTLTNDHGLVTLSQGESMLFYQDDAILRNTLESMFIPHAEGNDLSRVSTMELFEFVRELSPLTAHSYSFLKQSADREIAISFEDKETVDDSIQTVNVQILHPHPCSKLVGTRVEICESLTTRMKVDKNFTAHEKTTVAKATTDEVHRKKKLTIQEMIDEAFGSREIDMQSLTPYHQDNITEALSVLRQA